MIIKLGKVGFAFLLSSCFIMPLMAMDQQQPQEQNQQQELTEEETDQLRDEILQWINSPNRPAIEQFAKNHPNLSQLELLELNNNKIGAEGAKALATALSHFIQLKVLDLNNSNIEDVGAQHLAAALPQLTQLKALYLNNNNIRAEGAPHLAAALPRLTQLLELELNDNNIGDAGAQHLANALPQLTELMTLTLKGNNIGNAGAQALYQVVDAINATRPLYSRVKLTGIDRPQPQQQAQQQTQQQEVATLTTAEAQELVTAISTWIKNPSDVAVTQFAKEHPNLSRLQNLKLRGVDLKLLASLFQYLPQVQELDLRLHDIKNDDAQALAAALPQLSQVRTLFLDGCDIEPNGVQALYKVADTINVQRQANNQLKIEGIERPLVQLTKDIMAWIFNPGTITAEQFAGNHPGLLELPELKASGENSFIRMTDKEVSNLISLFQYLPQLQELDLSSNDIKDEKAQLATALKQLPQLKKVNLTMTGINTGIAKVLYEIAESINAKRQPNNQLQIIGVKYSKPNLNEGSYDFQTDPYVLYMNLINELKSPDLDAKKRDVTLCDVILQDLDGFKDQLDTRQNQNKSGPKTLYDVAKGIITMIKELVIRKEDLMLAYINDFKFYYDKGYRSYPTPEKQEILGPGKGRILEDEITSKATGEPVICFEYHNIPLLGAYINRAMLVLQTSYEVAKQQNKLLDFFKNAFTITGCLNVRADCMQKWQDSLQKIDENDFIDVLFGNIHQQHQEATKEELQVLLAPLIGKIGTDRNNKEKRSITEQDVTEYIKMFF